VAAPAPRAMSWERFVLGTDEALEQYNREHHQQVQPQEIGRPEPRPAGDEPKAESARPRDGALDESSFHGERQRASAVDEAIDRLSDCDPWWGRRGASEHSSDLSDRLGAWTGDRAIEIAAPRVRGASPASAGSSTHEEISAAASVAVGATAAGWAFRSLAER